MATNKQRTRKQRTVTHHNDATTIATNKQPEKTNLLEDLSQLTIDLVTKNRIRENNQRNLDRIQHALHNTLAELAFLEAEEAKTPGAYSAKLLSIRAKRDRQHSNAVATENYINTLKV